MEVSIVTFPETRVASITHLGAPADEYHTLSRLIAWRLERGFLDQARYRSYGVHYSDPRSTPPERYRVDFCLSIEEDVGENAHGIIQRVIPALRCALARDIGSRRNNQAALYLYEEWLPASGELPSGHPPIFHYVNVGPNVRDSEAITDVYLPIV
ncbi:MAG: GyrI-like domain-containing protein [Gammaproteobacteria bacterium]|nr:GyrI-like domain-containing protein [Gammaproteobacteria bacterium]